MWQNNTKKASIQTRNNLSLARATPGLRRSCHGVSGLKMADASISLLVINDVIMKSLLWANPCLHFCAISIGLSLYDEAVKVKFPNIERA